MESNWESRYINMLRCKIFLISVSYLLEYQDFLDTKNLASNMINLASTKQPLGRKRAITLSKTRLKQK